MKKTLILLLFVYCYANGQENPFMNDGNGRPLYLKVNYVADGSPYLFEEYNIAEITAMSGRVYRQVRVKINMLDNQVQYMTDKDEEMVTYLLIKKIKFSSVLDENQKAVEITLESFGEALNTAGSVMYQVIDSGKVMLLKKTEIVTRDEKKYGEAVITRHFERRQSDYLLLPAATPKKIEKGKAFFLEALADKRKEIDDFIEKNNNKCRTTSQYKAIISYYNSL